MPPSITLRIRPYLPILGALLLVGGVAQAGDTSVVSTPTDIRAKLGQETLRINGDLHLPSKPEEIAKADLMLVTAAISPDACKLRNLTVRAPFSVVGVAALQAPCFSGLTSLNLYSPTIDTNAVSLLLDAPFSPTLQKLGIGAEVTSSDLKRLLARLPMLEELSVHDPVTSDRISAIVAGVRPRLRKLSFTCSATGEGALMRPGAIDAAFLALGSARTLPALEDFSVCHAETGPHTVETLTRSGLGGRLHRLAGVLIRDPAEVRALVSETPNLVIVDFSSPEIRSAWSVARAPRLLKNGRLPTDLLLTGGYPAPTDLEVIDGRLEIVAPVGKLSGLRQLREVTGDLKISGDINDLSVLSHLRQVGGTLTLEGTNLTTLEVFSALERVGGNLNLYGNTELRSTRGLNRLREIGGRLAIPPHLDGNPRLAEIVFPALETVGKELCVASGPGQIRDTGDGCWCVDGPESTQVHKVKIRMFTQLVSANGCPSDEDADLLRLRPDLFPALQPTLANPDPEKPTSASHPPE